MKPPAVPQGFSLMNHLETHQTDARKKAREIAGFFAANGLG